MGKYDPRRPVYVTPFNGSTIKYGFNTNIDSADSAVLGHVDVTDAQATGLVFGANSPKPAKARKLRVTGTTSSYIDYAAITAARAAGWNIGLGTLRRGGSTHKTHVVKVTFKGVNYAWNMPIDSFNNVTGDLSALGVDLTTTSDTDLVFGARSPKPPKAKKTIGSGDSANTIRTFYDPDKDNLPDDWTYLGSKVNTVQAP